MALFWFALCIEVVKCAAHQANLVVSVAIVGKIMKNPIEEDDVCANAVNSVPSVSVGVS